MFVIGKLIQNSFNTGKYDKKGLTKVNKQYINLNEVIS